MLVFLLACPAAADAQERRFRSNSNAQAKEQRFALVVGNRAYPQGALVTPENDANDVAGALRKLGFEVVVATNLDPTRFRGTVRKFGPASSITASSGCMAQAAATNSVWPGWAKPTSASRDLAIGPVSTAPASPVTAKRVASLSAV